MRRPLKICLFYITHLRGLRLAEQLEDRVELAWGEASGAIRVEPGGGGKDLNTQSRIQVLIQLSI